MALYKDSLGNTYSSLPKGPPIHKAKPSHETSKRRSGKHRIGGVTKPTSKYARYRSRKGKPNGPGMTGNKAGKNKASR